MKSSLADKILNLFYQKLSLHANRLSLLLVLGCFFAVLGLRIYMIFLYQSDLGGVESNVIYTILRGIGGYNLYCNPEQPPFSITQYSPLYYYATIGICKALQIDPKQVHEIYIVSRAFSLICNLLFAGMSYWILGKIFNITGVLRGIAGIFSFVYLEVESFSRPDSLYNFFVLLTIGIFLLFLQKKENKEKNWYLTFAAIFSIITQFTKQSGIYIPCLLLFYNIFILYSWRYFIHTAIVMVITGGILLWLTAGEDVAVFFQNIIGGVNNGVSYNWWAKRMLILHIKSENIFDILGLFLGLWYLINVKNHAHRFLGLCALSMFLFANVTGLKIGSAPNYFTEFLALTFILISIFIHQNRHFIIQTLEHQKHYSILLLLCCTFTIGVHTLYIYHVHPKFTSITYQTYLENQEVVKFLEKEGLAPDDLVFTTTHRYDFLNKFLFKNSAFPQKEIVVANPPNAFEYSALHQAVQRGKLKYFIMRKDGKYVEPGVGEHFKGIDFSNFHHIKDLYGYSIYKNPVTSD